MSNHKNSVRIDHYFVTNCISFTMVILLFTILETVGWVSPLTPSLTLLLFGMTTCIMFVMMLTDRIPTSNNFMLMGMQILDIFIVLIVTNGICQVFGYPLLFHWKLHSMFILLLFNLIVYFTVYGVNIMKYRKDQNLINQKLQHNRLSSKKESQHE